MGGVGGGWVECEGESVCEAEAGVALHTDVLRGPGAGPPAPCASSCARGVAKHTAARFGPPPSAVSNGARERNTCSSGRASLAWGRCCAGHRTHTRRRVPWSDAACAPAPTQVPRSMHDRSTFIFLTALAMDILNIVFEQQSIKIDCVLLPAVIQVIA